MPPPPRSLALLPLLTALLLGPVGAQDLFGQSGAVDRGGGGGSATADAVLDPSLGFRYMALEPMLHEWSRAYARVWGAASTQTESGFAMTDVGAYLRAASAADSMVGEGETLGPHHGGSGPRGPAAGAGALLKQLATSVEGERGPAAVFHRIEARRLARVHAALLGWTQGVEIRIEARGAERSQVLVPAGTASAVAVAAPEAWTGPVDDALRSAVTQERQTLVRMATSNLQHARERLQAMLDEKGRVETVGSGFHVHYQDPFVYEGVAKPAALDGRMALVELEAQTRALADLEGAFGRAVPDPRTARTLQQLQSQVVALGEFARRHAIVAEFQGRTRSFSLDPGFAPEPGASD